MNYTKLDQLADECWVHVHEPLFSSRSAHWEFDRYRFAKLIIDQCAHIADRYFGPGPTARQAILEHFEIEP